MPCNDSNSWPNQIEQDYVDNLVRLLCEACKDLERAEDIPFGGVEMSDKLKEWWIKHQEEDRKKGL